MGLTKTTLFTDEQNQLARLAKALGHPARIAILQYLAKTSGCVCGSLVEEIGLAQPTISQHLKELKNVDLIQGTTEGTSICYCLNVNTWKKLKTQLGQLFVTKKEDGNSCC